MKKGYKDSPLGAIPIDWEVVKLGEVLDEYKLGGNYPNSSDEKGLPLIKMGNIGRGKINIQKIEYLPESYCYDSIDILQNNDLLFNTRNTLELVGKVALWRSELDCALYNSNLLRLKFKKSRVFSTFFMNFIFNSYFGISQLRSFATGTTSVAAIYTKDLLKFLFPLPPLAEQKRIAEVLTTVDDKIDNIGKQIDQFTALKKGLMQQLLTKGIDHTEFKDSPLGSIPKDWEVAKLGDVVNNYDNKRIPLKSEDRNKRKGNYPYYGAQGIIDYIDDYIFEGQYLLIAEDGENVKSRKNDIALLANGKFWVNNHAHVINNMKTSSLIFLKYFINQMDIKPFVTGLAQPKLNKDSLNKLMILLPPLAEQQKIAEILGSVDRKIDILESKREKVVDQKKGLMQKLLTGERRLPYKE